ncbi:MAG TPA: hypothetical protein VLG40_04610 [Candidatus Saccharimonas sp.]|nr:hypothetical protein [Candidatus Saccharimonas sp.]
MNDNLDTMLRQTRPAPRRELSKHFTTDTLTKVTATPQKLTFFQRLLHPAPALIAIFVICTSSAAAYAAFNWQQIQLHFNGSTTSKMFDAKELSFSYKDCDALGLHNTAKFGVLNDAVQSVSQQDLEDNIKTLCDIAQAKQLYQSQPDWKSTYPMQNPNQPVVDTYIFSGAPRTVKSIGTTLATEQQALDAASNHTVPVSTNDAVSPNARAYNNGKQIPISTIAPGDQIVYVSHLVQKHKTGQQYDTTTDEVVGIIKLDSKPLNPMLQNKIFAITPCAGNPDATCVNAPSVALRGTSFNSDEGEGGNTKIRKDVQWQLDGPGFYVAQGRITTLDADGITFKNFNNQSTFYVHVPQSNRNPQPKIGQVIAIDYVQAQTDDHKNIQSHDILGSFIIQPY